MKKLLLVLMSFIPGIVLADYALVIASSGPTLRTLTISNTLEQCQQTKTNFEVTFKEVQYNDKGKERYVLRCVELANGTGL